MRIQRRNMLRQPFFLAAKDVDNGQFKDALACFLQG